MRDSWDDLEDWLEEIEDDLQYVKKSAAKEMLRELTQPTQNKEQGKTPVDKGHLMANTQVSLNTPKDNELLKVDKTGYPTLAAGYAVVNRSTLWDTIYIQNNTAYNERAEFTGWKYTEPYRYFRTSINNTFEYVASLK